MYSPDSFKEILGFGNAGTMLKFNFLTLEQFGLNPDQWTKIGIFRETAIGSRIECFWCGSFIPVKPRNKDGEIKLYADCPKCGVYALSALERKLWQVDFMPLLTAAHHDLHCAGEIAEILPDVLWLLGRSPLAGQSREVWVCAGINSARNSEIIAHLPPGKTPILLIIGDHPRQGKSGSFPVDNIFNFDTIAALHDEKIIIDSAAIIAQLELLNRMTAPQERTVGKNSIIGDLIVKLKTELRQYIIGNYYAFLQAERSGREYELPVLKQIDLAQMLKVDKSYITRAMGKDRELKILFESANSMASTIAYGGKATR